MGRFLMGWAKFDDQFTDHPKVVSAGALAELLDVRAVIHCARYETDGFVQSEQLSRLSLGISSPKRQVAALVRVGLWEEVDGGWVIHDFLDYHPSAQQKHEEREAARERMAKVREKKGRSSPDVRPNTNGTSPYPDPSRPVPKAKPSDEPDRVSEEFDRFWDQYPRGKAGKLGGDGPRKPALQRWRRLSDEERAACLRAVENYAHHIAQPDSPNAAHVTTWLNQERWEMWQEGEGPRDVAALLGTRAYS